MVFQRLVGNAVAAEVGRNDPCPCGSGRKYKHCCIGKAPAARTVPSPPPRPTTDLDRIAKLRDAGRLLEAARQAQDYTTRRPQEAAGHAALGMVQLFAGRADEALPSFMQAARLAPSEAEHHRHAGFALAQLGRDGEAMTAFQRAIGLNPRDPEALDQLGVLLEKHNRRSAAFDCYRRAAAAEPDSVLGRINRAKVLLEDGDPAEAVAFLQQTIALFPANGEAKRFLAMYLREHGRFDEAIPLLEQATESSPAQAATAYLDLAMSKRITADDQPMLDQMRALLDYRPLQKAGRQRVHFGLGKALDDLGEYQAAMQHFDAANRIFSEARPFDRAHFGASVHRLIAGTTPEFFATNRGLGSESDLPVLILGMPRSGTTLVEQVVSSHPMVAGGDELVFWNQAAEEFGKLGATGDTAAFFQRVTAEYLAELRRIGPTAARVTDKMPGNVLWIGLFHLAFPNGRIIHCRRHPVDTCLSNYFADFASPMPFAYSKGDLAFYHRWYRRLMDHWDAVLPPGKILHVDYEALVADPEPGTRRMIDFLGLDWDPACLRPQDNQRAVKTASSWQARQPVYRSSTERWRNYEPWLGELRGLLEDPDWSKEPPPGSDNPAIPIARRLREAGRYDEALAVLREALRAEPTDAVMYSDAGTVCLVSGQVELAVDCFERAIGLSPNFAVAHYNLGAALERQGRLAEAMAALRSAIALAPDTGNAYSRLGNLLQAQGNDAEARACFQRASELATNPADRDLEEAKLLLGEGRAADAEPLLRRVIEANPTNGLAHTILGDVLGEAGRFDEAKAQLQRAIELDPERAGAWHNLAILTKVGDADRSLITGMEDLLARPGCSDNDRILLHFALGKAHDDLREYQQAIGHFDQGNALEHRRHTFDRAALAEFVDRLIESAPPPVAGVASDLPLCIIGMPRSGTTLVEQIVSAHPAVAAGGELTFWTERGTAGGATPAVLAEDYLALLRRIGPDALRVTDKNPFNFLWAGLIHQALPNARFIHCRRDPIDTCLSIYFTRFASAQPFAYDRGDLLFYYRQYQRLMAHWQSVLPPDRLLEIDYQELTADPEQQTRRIVAFCGLAWDDGCLAPERNERRVRTASIWQARQPVYRSSVERWRNYQPWLGELAELHAGGE